jgi:Ca-activated chloride channel homolog
MNKAVSINRSFRWPRTLSLASNLFLLSLLLLRSAQGQHCPGCASLVHSAGPVAEPVAEDAWVIKKQVNEVSVLFTASIKGKAVADLTKEDVVIRDDEQVPAAILEFHSQYDLPLRVGLLVDTSGSVHDRMRFEQAAARTFWREVIQGPDDLGFVMGFSNRTALMQDLTGEADKLSASVTALRADGGTSMFDAIAEASAKLGSHPESQVVAKVLVVLSDGDDNDSHIKLEDAIDAAQQAGVAVYTIGTYPHTDNVYLNDTHRVGRGNLKALAERTGGRFLRPDCVGQVREAFAKVQQELRSRYSISYRPANFVPDGHYRRIKVVVRKPGKKVEVRAREGYYARPPGPALAWNRD